MKKLSIIILAAGKGTRMKSNTHKVLHKICKKPMITHCLEKAISLNPEQIITVLSDDMLDVQQIINNRSEIVIQKEALGTGDSVKVALKKINNLDQNLLILYGDTPLVEHETLVKLITLLDKSDISVIGFKKEDYNQYGRLIVNSNNELESIVEFKESSEEQKKISLCNSGMLAAKANVISKLIEKIDNNNSKKEYFLTDIIKISKNAGFKVTYIEAKEEEVSGINDHLELSRAENFMQQKLRKKAMIEQGVTFLIPETVYISHDTKFGKDVVIEGNVTFGENVTICDNVTIRSFSHIEGATICKQAIIGPFARIRANTTIHENVFIGNFVEVKESNIEKDTKVCHLSYIGNATIGKSTNVGAGTITCNYDGSKKSPTTIGDNVFVGSNSTLIAPLTIGNESFIAAGSTITKDVSALSLAITRTEQLEKKQWVKLKKNKK